MHASSPTLSAGTGHVGLARSKHLFQGHHCSIDCYALYLMNCTGPRKFKGELSPLLASFVGLLFFWLYAGRTSQVCRAKSGMGSCSCSEPIASNISLYSSLVSNLSASCSGQSKPHASSKMSSSS
uniref:Uncharacterized protein n=1 Tax=Knipowitschia caucasica TaxID=637954 RepID=A0AAV2KMP3_KNICA